MRAEIDIRATVSEKEMKNAKKVKTAPYTDGKTVQHQYILRKYIAVRYGTVRYIATCLILAQGALGHYSATAALDELQRCLCGVLRTNASLDESGVVNS